MTSFERTLLFLRNLILYVLLFVTAISYHPTIIRMSRAAGFENGTILSRYIILLFGAVTILSLRVSTVKNSRLVRTYLVWLGIIGVAAGTVFAFFNNRIMLGDIRALVICLGAIFIGYTFRTDKRRLSLLILSFSATIVFSGLMQVLVNIGGFRIVGQYLADSKNSLGAMLAVASFSSFYLYTIWEDRIPKIAALGLAFLSFVIMVTIRARMAVVALAMAGLFYYYLLKRGRNILITLIAVGFASFLVLLLAPSSMVSYLDESFTAGSQGEDFTSGRLGTYLDAIAVLEQNPFTGNIRRDNQIGWVHNFPLLELYQYGMLFSWPILVLYLIILFRAIKRSIAVPARGFPCFAYVCLLIPFVISMGEPTFPFGPGTVTLFNFILLGAAAKADDADRIS